MKLIHYTDSPIEKLDIRDYPQSDLTWQAKPNGFWFSVEGVSSESHNYNWKEWCECNEYRVEALEFSYEIILHENSNILHLKTSKDILEFTKQYPLKTRGWDAEWDTYILEWEEVKKNHQGIIIAPYQWNCRLSLESNWYYGWDCSCGCVWDLTCIKEFIPINKELKDEQ